jgi:hypothetical protein
MHQVVGSVTFLGGNQMTPNARRSELADEIQARTMSFRTPLPFRHRRTDRKLPAKAVQRMFGCGDGDEPEVHQKFVERAAPFLVDGAAVAPSLHGTDLTLRKRDSRTRHPHRSA